MSMALFRADGVSEVLRSALGGVSLRQQVTADNIANVDTPGFRARAVEFESSLRSAIARGEVFADEVTVSTLPTNTPVGVNGNNVDLRKETMAAMQSVFQYQLLTRSAGDRLQDLKIAAGAF